MSSIMVVAPLLIALQTVVIDPAPRGVWEGWGTSLCWMGKAFGGRDDVADLLFTTKSVRVGDLALPGLGMNVVRYNAGACSWNEVAGRRMVVGRGIQPFRQMEGFWLDPTKGEAGWDWSVDAEQRAMMLRAKARGADRFELFSNSPMWWMCANDNPSGAARATDDNLRPDQADNFAIYMAEVAKRAKDAWGVRFTTVDPFNEPASSWWDAHCKQEGCHFSAATQADLLPRLRRALDTRRLRDLPLAASDETYVTQAIQTWNAFGGETKALVAQVNVHGYEGDRSPRAALRSVVGDRPLWLSEHGEGDASGLSMARSLAHDLNVLRPRVWCYWQPLDGGGWGFLDADVPNARIRHANPKHFVMAQYARHVRPGMTMLGSDDPDTVVAYDPRRRKLVIVAVQGPQAGMRTFDLSRFATARGPVARWSTEPRETARYARLSDLRVEGRRFETVLPPDSVQTFEVGGVQMPKER